ncbi:uncharacterized protein LOC121728028 isoform X2 [Aricia agestis]|uniref:uncharacterized protein LOC121728028 isoform X2 n=1 Tax=Aricia agestis TaxID=91739 RepID=UPI001C203522|nr:uncharacterized protein LOC121728028 isoform X2 [Aricia agestis]
MGDAEEQKAYLLFLENRTYRYLQHLAKSLSLPSNYKKVYLIELIYAKKYRTEEIVKTIIQRVKIERLLAAKNRLKRNRRKRFTMPPRTKSPAISATPKRQRVYVPFGSDLKMAIMRNSTRRSLLDVNKQHTLPRTSDRVLRSFNLRQSDNSNYNPCLLNNSECNKVQNALNTKAVIKINIPTGNFYKYYMNTECVVRKHRPAILNSTCNETRKPLILRQRFQDVGIQSNITAARRQRTISGIYPLPALRNCPQPIQTTEGVSMRNYDGSRSKLNAVIQKCNTNYKQKITYCDTEVNIQDLIDRIDDNIENQDVPSHRTAENFEPTPSPSILNSQEQHTEPATSFSYHIDRMRYQMLDDRSSQYTDETVLPKINEVFSKMNCMKNIAQPLYVQVSSEDELSRNYPLFADNCNTALLESLYNFKSQMLTNVPLLQIATTDNTKSTYTTSTVTTAEHHSASHGNDCYDFTLFEQDNRYMNDPRLYEFFRFSQQQRNSALNRSSSSTETYHERSTPATVPEMLEDAVELISQDGDYMEQIGMDVRVMCVLCEWAGPNILLENHILKEHGMCVVECEAGVGVSWSLAAMWRACACVLRRATALYVLRARYSDPDRLSAQLATISADPVPRMGEITVYNKHTGEPYSWMGYIQPLTNSDDSSGLRVSITQLDLLPNSANLKLLNRELVSYSLNRAVVGAPALNDINVVFNVKIE